MFLPAEDGGQMERAGHVWRPQQKVLVGLVLGRFISQPLTDEGVVATQELVF